jgi:hypothetical protein
MVDSLLEQASALLDDWCEAVDTHQLEQIRGLFAEGGTFKTRGLVMDGEQRDAFFIDLWTTRDDRSTHVCRDVEATRDGETVQIRAQLTATFILADGSVRLAWGHYDDTAAITPDGLRLITKQINLERIELLPVTP